MGIARCLKCGSKAESDNEEEAISLLNHAIGKTRGIRCGGKLAKVRTEGFNKAKLVKKTETTKDPKSIP